MAAVLVSVVWAGSAALVAGTEGAYFGLYQFFEVLRSAIWFIFLLRLLKPLLISEGQHPPWVLRYGVHVTLAFALLVLGFDFVAVQNLQGELIPAWVSSRFLLHLMLAILGLALIEQLFRNTRVDQRWSTKFLFLGLAGMFGYDFFLYADALLFKQMSTKLWSARGFINLCVVPMLAVSAARNPQWSLNVFVSRKMVFHTVAFVGAGVYLLVMSAVGFYIRSYGGTWGTAVQILFLFLSLLLLGALFLSGYVRARAKIFLSKHFFNYKYDYRDEWLKLSQTLSEADENQDASAQVIRALAELVDSPGGMLWVSSENGVFSCTAQLNTPAMLDENERMDSPFLQFLADKQWVINLHELEENEEAYANLQLPGWMRKIDKAWLIVPLILNKRLVGFVILLKPRAPRSINWEDRDLLKVVALQVSGQVTLLQTAQALMDARQFEAFNRLSSYVVHDLKNLNSQLTMVVANSVQHRDKPEFLDDAFETIENATQKLNKMLAQLRKDGKVEVHKEITDVAQMLAASIQIVSAAQPVPSLHAPQENLFILTEKERAINVFAHLLQNAQQACDSAGRIVVRVRLEAENVMIEIEDNGVGMDQRFIQQRLFRPFDTTKGNAGMGIGTYESREFIWSEGGDLTVTSAPGKGTVFRVQLPSYTDAPDKSTPDKSTLVQ